MTENEVVLLEVPEAPAVDASEDAPDAPADSAEGGTGTELVETVYVAVLDDRPIMTTAFQDYTVTEGLLLLVFALLLVQFFLNLVRRWF